MNTETNGAAYIVMDDNTTVKETKSAMNIETHSSLDCRETHS